MFRRVILVVVTGVAFAVVAMPATASAADWKSCPKLQPGEGTIRGENWKVLNMSCRAGKRVRKRYNEVSTRPYDTEVRPRGFSCKRSPREGMVRCTKDGRKVDFWETKVFTS